MTPYAVGIDIGATNIKSVAITREGAIAGRMTAPTGRSRAEWVDRLRMFLSGYESALGGEASGISVAAPGLPARDGRSISWMRGRLDDLQGVDWQEMIGCTTPVRVINDGQAAVLGEAWTGAAAGSRNVLMVTLGTGVGGGAIVDGRVLRGNLGRAGHVGHIALDPDGRQDIVGTPGSLEDAIGDCSIRSRSGGAYTSTLALVQAFQSGDAEASRIWLRSIRYLAAGIASLINVLDPELIVVGGGMSAAGKSLLDPLAIELDSIEWRPAGTPVRIVAAQLGEWAGAVGSGRIAWYPEGVFS